MKILSVEQLAEADKITIEKQGITSGELMERAATYVFEEIHKQLAGDPVPIKIFCGIGNNGGDGLVIGRLLMEQNYNVTIYVVNYSNNRSPDFLLNYNKIKEMKVDWPTLLKGQDDIPELSSNDFIVDAIFGIGLNRPVEGWVAKLIEAINASKGFVLSVDMPSGLFASKSPSNYNAIVKSNYTLSFQSPKLTFFLPKTAGYVGNLQVLNIGLDKDFMETVPAIAQIIGKEEANVLYKPRKSFSHKGDYGHSLIIGGSYGKIGSISLTATATLKTGAGLVSIYSPKCGYNILQTLIPEAMVLTDKNEEVLSSITFDLEPDVICFGMGAGTSSLTVNAFRSLLEKTRKPLVIDADGINILSANKELLVLIPKNSVLTPHPKELERLLGSWNDDFDKIEKAKQFSSSHQVILVLKDAYTITVFGQEIYINTTGNPGMATAGAGDVLAGVITSLISQKYEILKAAVFGVYLHGTAGDLCANKMSYEATTAGDITQYIGEAFLDLFKNNGEGSHY